MSGDGLRGRAYEVVSGARCAGDAQNAHLLPRTTQETFQTAQKMPKTVRILRESPRPKKTVASHTGKRETLMCHLPVRRLPRLCTADAFSKTSAYAQAALWPISLDTAAHCPPSQTMHAPLGRLPIGHAAPRRFHASSETLSGDGVLIASRILRGSRQSPGVPGVVTGSPASVLTIHPC